MRYLVFSSMYDWQFIPWNLMTFIPNLTGGLVIIFFST